MKLLINADDFGRSREINEAIAFCFSRGLIQRTTLMVNMPFCEEACRICREQGFSGHVGLHLNLVEGIPLTEPIRHTGFCDENGEFNGSLQSGKKRFFMTAQERKAVREEIEAQIRKYVSLQLPLMHLDSHRHSHTQPTVMGPLLPLMKQYGFHSLRLCRNIPAAAMKGPKALYKNLVNVRFKSFNRKNGSTDVNKFGSQDNFEEELAKTDCTGDSMELMVHPVYRDGVMVDAIHGMNIEDWLTAHRDLLQRSRLEG